MTAEDVGVDAGAAAAPIVVAVADEVAAAETGGFTVDVAGVAGWGTDVVGTAAVAGVTGAGVCGGIGGVTAADGLGVVDCAAPVAAEGAGIMPMEPP